MQEKVKKTIHKKVEKVNTKKCTKLLNILAICKALFPHGAFAGYHLELRILLEEKIRTNKVHCCKRNTIIE